MTTLTPQQLIQLAEFAGWKWNEDSVWSPTGSRTARLGNSYLREKSLDLPDYPNDLDACIRDLVGKMKSLGFTWGASECGDLIMFKFLETKPLSIARSFEAKAPTLSLAICLAVVKYLESLEKNSLPQSASGV